MLITILRPNNRSLPLKRLFRKKSNSIVILSSSFAPFNLPVINCRMTSSSQDFNFLIWIINLILRLIRQDLKISISNTNNKRPFNPFITCIVIFCSCYTVYLLNCLAKMKNLEKISEILWILPMIIQLCSKSLNGEMQRKTSLEFVSWMKDVMESTNPNQIIIQRNVKVSNDLCMKIAKYVVWSGNKIENFFKRKY